MREQRLESLDPEILESLLENSKVSNLEGKNDCCGKKAF